MKKTACVLATDICIKYVKIILIVIIPPIIKSIKERKQQQLKHEADRKEQERRESMGEWK